jgi:ubiquinol-cytochrome c reductase cytochrome b subunit
MKAVFDWLDQRTGFRKLADDLFFANIPGGARWRYATGTAIIFCLAIQFVTGVALWLGYSPSTQTAWESVNYLQNEVSGGWLLRGLHHYTAQILPVILALHLMQVIIGGAYKAPREVNFWFTLLLIQIVLFLALTGYQLPWDQKGFWATKVAMNILGIVPLVGHSLQMILIGGSDYGQLTLTRFFGVHAGILPGTLILLLIIHAWLFRRHGFKGAESSKKPDAAFWPDQALRNAVVCLVIAATLLFLIVRHRLFGASGPLGAALGAPADPSEPYSAARPEWYFLFLFQFLKYFPAQMEIVGALIIPGLVMTIIFLMPFIGRTNQGHRFNIGFLACLFVGIGFLSFIAFSSDANNPEYQAAVKAAGIEAARVKQLTRSPAGIPPAGAIALLRNDPFTQGPKLFAKNCASCHRFNGGDGLGNSVKDPESASDLAGFGSREWLAGLLDPARITTTNYFGATKLKDGKMPKFVATKVAHYTPEQKAQLEEVIAAVSAEAQLKSQSAKDQHDAAAIIEGRTLFRGALSCADCHQFHETDDTATAPDLTGYGSREWLVKFLNNPAHPNFYGDKNDRMPAFGEKQILTPQSIGLIADWLRGDWYEPAP